MKYSQFSPKQRIAKYNSLKIKSNLNMIGVLVFLYCILLLIGWFMYPEWSDFLGGPTIFTDPDLMVHAFTDWKLYVTPFVILLCLVILLMYLASISLPSLPAGKDD